MPKECRFPADQSEVLVRREGRAVILEPVDEWPASFLAVLGAWDEDIPRPPQPLLSELKDPFE
ncbi:MAG TPA: hypothetical protein VF017_07815 [Thermoanaerobaculia bacterium]|nr:hypothetical protein [Thermoanaerobaculia bacterium]